MSVPIVNHEKLSVNEEDDAFDNISIDQDDPSFQYTNVPNALIRDNTISPNCRWLIIYLLSNKPGWSIKSRQLWQHTKGFIGRDGIRKVLNQAIEAGYIRREVVTKGNLRGFKYTVASYPKFKKCFRRPEIQDTELREPERQGPEKQGIKELLSKELLSKDITSLKVPVPNADLLKPTNGEDAAKAAETENKTAVKPKKEKQSFTEKVHEVGDQLIDALIRTKPDYSPPKNRSAFLTEIDFLLRLDKRDPQKILDVFNWALSDSFWADKMFKPNPSKYLRDKFDQLEMKMNAKPSVNPNQVDRRLRDKEGKVVDAYKDSMF